MIQTDWRPQPACISGSSTCSSVGRRRSRNRCHPTEPFTPTEASSTFLASAFAQDAGSHFGETATISWWSWTTNSSSNDSETMSAK